jgi:hypothetical protein
MVVWAPTHCMVSARPITVCMTRSGTNHGNSVYRGAMTMITVMNTIMIRRGP